MKITKKINKDMFEKILSGKKKFYVRLGDMRVDEGDTLILKECEGDGNETGREIEKKIGIVLDTKKMPEWTEEEKGKFGFIIMGFKE